MVSAWISGKLSDNEDLVESMEETEDELIIESDESESELLSDPELERDLMTIFLTAPQ